MKSVNIEEPCHEDWSAMTPSQKGAFCDKCSIDVIDFSTRTKEEVKSILLANKDKHMCGRFSKKQLAELNYDYTVWENQTSRTFQSKFLYACLIAFGMTLFTGCIEDEEIMGEIGVEHFDTADQSSTERAGGESYDDFLYEQGEVKYIPKDTNKTKQTHKKGKVKYVPEENTNCGTEELMVKGEVMIIDEIPKGDTIVDQIDKIIGSEPEKLPEENQEGPPDTLYWDAFEMGDIVVDPDYYQHLIDTAKVDETSNNTSLNNGTNTMATKNLTVSVFPNPTANTAAIVLNVPNAEVYELDLNDLSGKHLSRIYSGILPKGVKRFEIELGAYESGTFIVTINSDSGSQTVKVQKVL